MIGMGTVNSFRQTMRVYFYTEWNGRPINPAGYTDFGTLIEYLKGLQKRGSGV